MSAKRTQPEKDAPRENPNELRKGGVGYNPPAKVDPTKREFPVSSPRPKK